MSTVSNIKIRDMSYAAIFAALLAVTAQITVPMAGGVPVTLQTYAVALAGIILGARLGAVSSLIYLLIGAIGIPVFAGMRGGLGVIFGPTGGFLISYPFYSFITGLAAEKARHFEAPSARICTLAAGLLLSTLVDYLLGTVWYCLMTGNSLEAAIAACVAPFVINDIIKLILAAWTGTILRRALSRAGLI